MGELLQLEKADWNLEIGCIEEIVSQRPGKRPALLFDKIKDYPKRISDRHQCPRLPAPALSGRGLSPGLQARGFYQPLAKDVPGAETDSAQVCEDRPRHGKCHHGPSGRSSEIPRSLVHHLDGGRYIATGAMSITKDPDEGWINVGTYRGQLIDQRSIGWYISPGKHAASSGPNISRGARPVRPSSRWVRTRPFTWRRAWKFPGVFPSTTTREDLRERPWRSLRQVHGTAHSRDGGDRPRR